MSFAEPNRTGLSSGRCLPCMSGAFFFFPSSSASPLLSSGLAGFQERGWSGSGSGSGCQGGQSQEQRTGYIAIGQIGHQGRQVAQTHMSLLHLPYCTAGLEKDGEACRLSGLRVSSATATGRLVSSRKERRAGHAYTYTIHRQTHGVDHWLLVNRCRPLSPWCCCCSCSCCS